MGRAYVSEARQIYPIIERTRGCTIFFLTVEKKSDQIKTDSSLAKSLAIRQAPPINGPDNMKGLPITTRERCKSAASLVSKIRLYIKYESAIKGIMVRKNIRLRIEISQNFLKRISKYFANELLVFTSFFDTPLPGFE